MNHINEKIIGKMAVWLEQCKASGYKDFTMEMALEVCKPENSDCLELRTYGPSVFGFSAVIYGNYPKFTGMFKAYQDSYGGFSLSPEDFEIDFALEVLHSVRLLLDAYEDVALNYWEPGDRIYGERLYD